MFNVLSNTSNLHWFCKRCEHGAIEAAKEASLCASEDIPQPKTGLVEKMIIDVRKEISEVKNELKCTQKAAGSVYAAKTYAQATSSIPASDDSATDPAQNINRNNNVSAKAKVMPQSVHDSVTVMEEIIDRDKRKNNFVIYILQESTAAITADHEREEFKNISTYSH